MRLWREQVLPRAIDRLLDNAEVRTLRARACAGLRGDVVEIGFGSGLDVAHYPGAVTGVWAVEPSAVARALAAPRIAAASTPVTFAGLDGQALDLPSDRFDSALSVLTLCTIPDASAAVAELLRVVRRGGAIHLLEHGRSPDAPVARWQDRVQPVHGALSGGCRLDRRIDEVVRAAGGDFERLETYYVRGPRPWSYIYEGVVRV